MKVIPRTGGTPQTLIAEDVQPLSAHWASDDRIFFTNARGVAALSFSTRQDLAQITERDPSRPEVTVHAHPMLLPNGKGLIYTVHKKPR